MPNKDKSKPTSGRPQTAVELAPEGVLAATIPQGSDTPSFAFAPLASGVAGRRHSFEGIVYSNGMLGRGAMQSTD